MYLYNLSLLIFIKKYDYEKVFSSCFKIDCILYTLFYVNFSKQKPIYLPNLRIHINTFIYFIKKNN